MPVVRGRDLNFVDLPGRRTADPLPARLAGGCSVRVVRVPPGPRTPHRHPYSCEVVYVAAGRGRVWEDDSVTEVAPGDLVVIPPGVPHATVATGRELTLVCFFPHPDLARNLEELAGPVRT
ncbi:MAG: cupin domain-containing protein [Micromonosporaceae bacterium]